jgi:predicted 3-demethylubiquinone-9 3-methyltransferase (glyoxalase superfamily)
MMPQKEKTSMQKITPFLWFEDQAIEAAQFYVSIFKDSRLLDDIDEEDSSISFELYGQRYIAFNGGPYFKFTPAISMFVDCVDQEEVDYYWDKLTEGGEAGQCGWLTDKFGVSWQIIPSILFDFLNHPDPIKAQKAMDAMLKMKKLDIAALKAAVES